MADLLLLSSPDLVRDGLEVHGDEVGGEVEEVEVADHEGQQQGLDVGVDPEGGQPEGGGVYGGAGEVGQLAPEREELVAEGGEVELGHLHQVAEAGGPGQV